MDCRLLSRFDQMKHTVELTLDGNPVFLKLSADRKMFYKIAKRLGFSARVKKMTTGGWLAVAVNNSKKSIQN